VAVRRPTGSFLSPVVGCLSIFPPYRIATRKGLVRDADITAGLIQKYGHNLISGCGHDPSADPRQTARSSARSAERGLNLPTSFSRDRSRTHRRR
jgi:hypothetical protein